jgi:3,4-dihydroxy 2-butanone 4-phosphate synthase/GTP cyclohydrolase II
VLADPETGPDDLLRPGHVLPLRAREGGVLVRPGHTEAAVDLARLAGRQPAGVIAEMVEDEGTMRRTASCRAFADQHQLSMISIEDLRDYRLRTEEIIRRVVATQLPTQHGVLTAVGYSDQQHAEGQVALVAGLGPDGRFPDGDEVLVRIHSECLTGEALGSRRCDCGPQLESSIEQIATAGRGAVVYLRGHEGRGIGLLAKLQAYALQDQGFDTVEANVNLGLPVDAREYRAAADILKDLGVRSVRLLTNNPAKVMAMRHHGIEVSARLPLVVGVQSDNSGYLRTKRERLGHHLLESLPGRPSTSVRRGHSDRSGRFVPVPTWSRPDDAAAAANGS